MVAVIGGGGARPSKKLRPPIHNMPPLPGNHACFQQHQLSQPMGGDATSAKPLYLFLSLSLSLSLLREESATPRWGCDGEWGPDLQIAQQGEKSYVTFSSQPTILKYSWKSGLCNVPENSDPPLGNLT